jgi:ubiquinone/menaquinone biosynthesis C-methylase UbiE
MDSGRRHVDRIRDQFGRQAEAYRRLAVTRDEAALAALVALSGAGASDRALDVACGPGYLTMAFAARCREAVGLDATSEFVMRASEEAEERGLSNAVFVLGEADRIDFEAGSFDVVACRAAFHHFPDPERVLREMARVARPGGRLLVADMLGSEDPLLAAVHDEIERLCDPTHVRALPASAFAALFRRLDLTLLHEPRSKLHYDLDEWLAHGGPDAAAAERIRRLLEESLVRDRCGLEVRREQGRLRFSHTGAAFVLRTPAA